MWFALALGVQLLALACGDDDNTCPTYDLDELCHGKCAADPDAASARLCSGPRGAQEWFEAENDCGGRTIRSAPNFTGVTYHFDAKNKLVGASTWTDSAEDECGFTMRYGRSCKAERFVSHDCPTSADAAVEP